MQLAVKDGMAKISQISTQISTVIKKCLNLVPLVRRSTIVADELKGKTRLQADNVTRWNSQLKMITAVLSISESNMAQVENALKLYICRKKLNLCQVTMYTPHHDNCMKQWHQVGEGQQG